jgi:hypothetical protein
MEEQDRRYRVLITLQRSDRPRYWTFNCHNCNWKVCELSNTEVVAASDVMDMHNGELVMVGVRCDGRSPTGIGRCNRWYYFMLGEKAPRKV